MTRRLAAAWLCAGGLAAFAARADVAPAPASFDYLYIRAHEGSASGGHAAIRFGDDTFDFQQSDGWVAPRREDSRRFQLTYRSLENRGIELSRVEASPETVALLRRTFERRLLAQSRQLELLSELEADVSLLDALGAGEPASLPVRGAGFFRESGVTEAGAPQVLSELRERIAARHGAAWLARRRDEALHALRDVSLAPLDAAAVRADPLTLPLERGSLSRRSAQSLAALAACELLAHPRPLRDGVRAGEGLGPDPWLRLDAPLRARLLELRASLLDAAVALAASRRPDWGEALLLAGARLALLDESLAKGELVMLDAFPAKTRTLRVGPRRRALLPTLQDDVRRDFVDAYRRILAARGSREAAWNELEEAVTRRAELRAVEAGAPQLRIAVTAMLPEGFARLPLAPLPAAPQSELGRAAREAREGLRAYRGGLEGQYRYHLVTRNCVSELFRTIEAAFVSEPGAHGAAADRDAIQAFVQAESQRRLGGYVDPLAAANFIPFVSSRNVREGWTVVEARHLPSAREHALEKGGLAAALRESNVWSSAVYEPSEGAGFFVFFTDGSWPLRPLLGAANLVAALARSGVGMLQLPFDGGHGLRAGLDGALWSAPELFFVNIRKGTNEYVPPDRRPPPG